MPEACPVCEARREQTRLRVKRYRERRNAAPTNEGSVTARPERRRRVTPLQTSPVGGTSLSVETGKGVEAILAPFEARGYRHEPAFWAKMAGKYPGVDLELEAMKLAEWLDTPKNAKVLCSKARIDRWLKKTHAELQAPPSNGTPNGVYHQPISQQHNRRPEEPRLLTGDLTPIRPAELHRFQAERRKLSLEQRMAQWRGAGK